MALDVFICIPGGRIWHWSFHCFCQPHRYYAPPDPSVSFNGLMFAEARCCCKCSELLPCTRPMLCLLPVSSSCKKDQSKSDSNCTPATSKDPGSGSSDTLLTPGLMDWLGISQQKPQKG
jgi:hypothetical protein